MYYFKYSPCLIPSPCSLPVLYANQGYRNFQVCKKWKETAQEVLNKIFQDVPYFPNIQSKGELIDDHLILQVILAAMCRNFFNKTKFVPIPFKESKDTCHWDKVNGIVFNGNSIISSSDDLFVLQMCNLLSRSLKIWSNGKCKTTFIAFPSPANVLGDYSSHEARSVDPWVPKLLQLQNGKMLIQYHLDLQMYDWNTKKMLFTVAGTEIGKMNQDGSLLAAFRKSTLQISNSKNGEYVTSIPNASYEKITSICMRNDFVAFGNEYGGLRIASGILGSEHSFTDVTGAHKHNISHTTIVDNHLISGSSDKTICITDLHTGKVIRKLAGWESLWNNWHAPWWKLHSMYADDWRLVVGDNSAIHIYDRRITSHNKPELTHDISSAVTSLDVDGFRMVCGTLHKNICLWDYRKPTCTVQVLGYTNNDTQFRQWISQNDWKSQI